MTWLKLSGSPIVTVSFCQWKMYACKICTINICHCQLTFFTVEIRVRVNPDGENRNRQTFLGVSMVFLWTVEMGQWGTPIICAEVEIFGLTDTYRDRTILQNMAYSFSSSQLDSKLIWLYDQTRSEYRI